MEYQGLSHDPEPALSQLELLQRIDEMFLQSDLEVIRILSKYLGDDDE